MKQKKRKKEDKKQPEGPKGLGGWLILFQIGLIVSSIQIVFLLLSVISEFTSDIADILNLIYVLIFGTLITISLIKFYKKKNNCPKFLIILLWVGFAFNLFFAIYNGSLNEEIVYSFDLIISLIVNIIWTLYLKKSKRVKNTFVN